jgi:hypothetical protein
LLLILADVEDGDWSWFQLIPHLLNRGSLFGLSGVRGC